MGPGAREEGTEDDDDDAEEEAETVLLFVFTVVVVSARLRNLSPCSRGPRGTSISPR